MKSDKKSILILFIIYTIANVFFLINYNGIYWDDWELYDQEYDAVLQMFLQAAGNLGYINTPIRYIIANSGDIGIFLSRVLIFSFIFFSGIFIFKILARLTFISKLERMFVVLFFIIAPLNSAKIALINFQSNLRICIFFFAFYLLSKYLVDEKGKIGFRILLLCLFFISFGTNSVLVFYAIVLLYIFYITYSYENSVLKNIYTFIKTKIDFILLPIIFFVIKSIYFVPSGLSEGYNKINLNNIINLKLYFQTFQSNFIVPIQISFFSMSSVIIILILLLLLLSNLFTRQNNEMHKKDVYLFILGLVIFFLGAFPYIAVGKTPSLGDWASRFQLLLPLGFSFILYYGIQISSNLLNFKEIVKYFVYLILIISFIMFHMKEQIKYNIDWYYQKSIIENFKTNDLIIKNNTFIINNKIKKNLAQNRYVRFYEFNGMSREAFGKDDKFFVNSEKELRRYSSYKNRKQMNFYTWNENEKIYFTIKDNSNLFNQKSIRKNIKYLFRLKYLELFKPLEFKKEISNLISIEFTEK
ncbi:MAG: hypothetical protein ACNI3C_02035 [Candidatus Marinarcus sp.]|uniref:hypothetical protein n=1 Tax=Candidatus Marinarcus sp. TaxID=3100987 RepID=UPI003B005FCB